MMPAVLSAMSPSTLPPLEIGSAASLARGGRDFASMLRSAGTAGAAGSPSRREAAAEAVSQLVSAALVQPALGSLRGGTFSEGPFAPGMAERRFGPLLDREIADRVVHAANFPIIGAILDRLPPSALRAMKPEAKP
jgi:hypothetical protein